ncbi:MAG: hypothetical protein ABJK28_01240 [Algibacter sp.]
MKLKINGNTPIETKKIDSLDYLKIHKNYSSIKSEIDSIQNVFFKAGYIENNLLQINKLNDTLFIAEIHLKNKYHNISIYYNKNEISQTLLESISNKVNDDYFEIPLSEIEKSLEYINSKTTELGLPFSKLKLTDIKVKDSHNLEAKLIIDSQNKKRVINNIVVKGYEKFPRSYLKHFLKIKKNQLFDLKTINEKTTQINDLRFANQIKGPEVLFSKDSTSLYIYVEKSQSNSFDGFLGFGTNEDTNKLEFDGYLNLNLMNNLNFGETFRLLYKSDENDQNTFETNLTLPYLFKSPIGVDLQLNIFRRDSSFSTAKQSAKIHYQINSKHKVYTGVSNTKSDNLLSSNINNQIDDFNTNYYSLAYEYIKPQSNNLLFPYNAALLIETNFGERENNSNSEKQSLLIIDAFKIVNFNNKNSIYIRVNGSNLNSNSYFENELLRFGGINSIRGFEENSILASQYGLINSEYRYQLNNSIFIHTITDVAYFENKLSNTDEKLFGYGFGFGILTKSGLLKLNYANGKSENQKFKLSNSKIHISLKAQF